MECVYMDVNWKSKDVSSVYTNSSSAIQPAISSSAAGTTSVDTVSDYEKGKIAKEKKADLPITDEDARKIADELNNFMQYLNTDIRFTLNDKLKQLVVQVVDTRDNTVLKQFPPQELLDTMVNIREYIGALLDKKA